MTTMTTTRERPILFSGPMVRAILDGRKTQTRRVVKARRWDADGRDGDGRGEWCTVQPLNGWTPEIIARDYPCPYGAPGDRLWVRETWAPPADGEATPLYRADRIWDSMNAGDFAWPWKPSIHMPRAACRLTLEITGVRVERVQDISDVDALAEGCSTADMRHGDRLASVFARLWDGINAARGYGWDANPWVWVLTFRRVEASA